MCGRDEEAFLNREHMVNMDIGDPQKTAGNCFHYPMLLNFPQAVGTLLENTDAPGAFHDSQHLLPSD